jgi:transcriptional regulator of acetoin/glycerol metabolism
MSGCDPHRAARPARNAHSGVVTVSWHPTSITRAIRDYATAASEEELQLSRSEAADRAAIVAALDANDWRIAPTAQALGVSHGTLWKRMRLYIIDEPFPDLPS